jgi:YD repeat-containing protein
MSAPIGITGASFLLSNISFKATGVGPHTLISYPSSFSAPEDATSLTLYRFVDRSITGNQVDFPVSSVTVNDGVTDRSTCFEYNFSSAALDVTGSVAQYNEVSTIPGSSLPSVKPFGYTKTFFFNGLTAAELGVSTMPVDLRWNGLVYETDVFDAGNLSAPVSSAKNTYSMYSRDLLNDQDFKVDVGYYVRPMLASTIADGMETKSSNESYDPETGLVKQVSLQRGTGPVLRSYLKYWWEVYDNGATPRSMNLLTPVVQTKKAYDGQTVDVSATRWKNWTCAVCPSGTSPAPLDSYAWKRNGVEDFSAWNETDLIDATGWKLATAVKVNDKGQLFQTTDLSGRSNSTLWDPTLPLVLADISNATLGEVIYEGFEGCTTGCSTDAKTGEKSSQAVFNVVLPAQGTYTLSYWSKTTGDWSLNVSTISSNTAIGGSGMLIDEVRLHPQNARMTTYSYDDFGNVTSICDENNEITYREYDEFNRLKLVRDKQNDIVERHTYNLKAN